MPIKSNLSRILGERRMKMSELAERAGIAKNTVLTLYHARAKGITFEVMDKICIALDCQPGDLFEYIPDQKE
ncbi:MAG: helix-turn-helix transcriptional regulator [Firmicutes bacterium]|nr:helix-turn-helix transcriptional regulator [Bacillota bacterium]